MVKKIVFYCVCFLILGCKKPKNKTDFKSPKSFYSEERIKELKSLIFNIDSRLNRSMASVEIDSFHINKNSRDLLSFIKNDSSKLGEIYKIEYNVNYNLVLEYFKIKNHKILRVQSKIKDGIYDKKHLFPMLFDSSGYVKLLTYNEFEYFCKENKLFNESDTLFYGYKLKDGSFYFKSSVESENTLGVDWELLK
ncbi:MAG: hypothetical protein MK202_09270 [Tenacibaculum sp.]|nr:hypothetical protein [Tenacibaculum sp.]